MNETNNKADDKTKRAAGAEAPGGVRLHGIEKYYEQFHAVKNLDLSVRPGELVTFLGRRG